MDYECKHCKALLFHCERKTTCCQNGKYKIDPLPNPSPLLLDLYTNKVPKESNHFLEKIRAYNCLFNMTIYSN